MCLGSRACPSTTSLKEVSWKAKTPMRWVLYHQLLIYTKSCLQDMASDAGSDDEDEAEDDEDMDDDQSFASVDDLEGLSALHHTMLRR